MAEKQATTRSSSGGEVVHLEAVVSKPSAEELLSQAATALEAKKGPRAPKTYQLLAAEVRALAQRIGEIG